MPIAHRTRSRRAMTLMELMIGLMIMGLVMSAMASFLLAVNEGWEQSEEQQRESMVSLRVAKTFESTLNNALYVGQYADGINGVSTPRKAYLFFWRADDCGGSADGKIQVGEMSLLDFDATTGTLWLYERNPWSSLSGGILSSAQAACGDVTLGSLVTYYKSASFVTRRPIIGPGTTGITTSAKLKSITFGISSTADVRPVVSYSMVVDRSGNTQSVGGRVMLRCPKVPTP